jgi:hypothetical protein
MRAPISSWVGCTPNQNVDQVGPISQAGEGCGSFGPAVVLRFGVPGVAPGGFGTAEGFVCGGLLVEGLVGGFGEAGRSGLRLFGGGFGEAGDGVGLLSHSRSPWG